MPIERPDFGDGERTSFAVPAPAAAEPSAPNQITAEMQASQPGSETPTDDETDSAGGALGFSADQVDSIEAVIDMALEEQPELQHLPVASLPADVRQLIARPLLESPHLLRDGERFLRKVYDRATLLQAKALDDWLCALPDEIFGGEP